MLAFPFVLPSLPCVQQIEFVSNGSVPSDLSEALVLDKTEMHRLQERIDQLGVEKLDRKDLSRQTHMQHVRLKHELKDMAANIQGNSHIGQHLVPTFSILKSSCMFTDL